jgi:hypothetical protein
MPAPYLPTPFNFDQEMIILGEQNGGPPYQYTYTSVPTDAASYATNVTWLDSRTQPTWEYLTTGGGWMSYNYYYQNNTVLVPALVEPGLDAVANSFPAQVQTDWNATSGLAQILNKPALAAVATSGSYADLSGRPMLAMVATSGSYNDLSNKPTRVFSNSVSRTLNAAFQPSTTRDAIVNYSISISAVLSLSSGQTGTASLQISSDGVTFVEISRFSNGNTGTLSLGLNLKCLCSH